MAPEGTVKQALEILQQESKVRGPGHPQISKVDAVPRDEPFLNARAAVTAEPHTKTSFGPTTLFLLESKAWSDWEDFTERERVVLRRIVTNIYTILTSEGPPPRVSNAQPSEGALALALAVASAFQWCDSTDEEDSMFEDLVLRPWIPTPTEYVDAASRAGPLIAAAMAGAARPEFLHMIDECCSVLRRPS